MFLTWLKSFETLGCVILLIFFYGFKFSLLRILKTSATYAILLTNIIFEKMINWYYLSIRKMWISFWNSYTLLPLSVDVISSNLWIRHSQSQFWWGSFNKFNNLACIFQFVHETCRISLDAQASRYLSHIPNSNIYPFSNNSTISSCIYCPVSFNLILVSQFNS